MANKILIMLGIFSLALLSIVSATDYGTNCTDISITGPSAYRADITFVGHGYANNATEMARLKQDVLDVINFTFSREPYSNYSTMFNFRWVNQSANLSCIGVACDTTAAKNLANANCPVNDKIYILVGDAGYGGFGGGQVAMGGTQTPYKGYAFSHEMGGHSFGELMDEYNSSFSGNLYYSGANCATPAQANYVNDTTPCTKWGTIPGAGCYASCSYYNLYRSTWNSVMRTSASNEFNRVSIIEIVNRVDFWSNMTSAHYPLTNYNINKTQSAYFNVTKVNESDNSTFYWYLNDAEITENRGNLSLNYTFNSPGNYTVKAMDILYEINETYSWNVSVAGVNLPPSITSYSPETPVSLNENSSITFNITAEDPENSSLFYSWKLDNVQQSTNQNWTYSPDFGSAGNHNITVTVSDGSLTAYKYWNVTVNNINRAPVLDSISDKTVNENSQLTFSITASDDDLQYGDSLSYSANSTLTVNKISNTLAQVTWTPTYNDAGIYYFNLTAIDGSGASDSKIVKITVNNVNRAPVLDSISDKIISIDTELKFNITASDADNDALTYASDNSDVAVNKINDNIAEVSWTPHSAGINYVKFNASDGNAADEKTVKITVIIDSLNISDCQNLDYSTTYYLQNDIPGASGTCFNVLANNVTLDCQNHAIAGDTSGFGVYINGFNNLTVKNCKFSNFQEGMLIASSSFSSIIGNTFDANMDNGIYMPPYASNNLISDNIITNNAASAIYAQSSDGNTFSGNLMTGNGGGYGSAAILLDSSSNNTFINEIISNSAIPDFHSESASDNRIINMTFNSTSYPTTASFTYSGNIDIASADAIADAGSLTNASKYLSITTSSSVSLNMSYDSIPASINEDTLKIYENNGAWTAVSGSTVNKARKTVHATITESGTYAIMGNKLNHAPVLDSIGDKSVNGGSLLQFTISANDPDLDTLTYSAENLPSGANFNAGTKTFSWTPSNSQNGAYHVSFNVTDGSLMASETITITVSHVNHAPVLDNIANITAYEGDTIKITPNATDSDNDTITYSYSGWMNSNSKATGYSDAGAHSVNVTASDGSLSDSKIVWINVLNSYEFRTAIADRNTQARLSGSVLINGTSKSTDASTTATFSYVHSNTEYSTQYSSSGYKTDAYPIYFDNRLASCTSGADCSLTGTYSSDCKWNSAYGDWTCSVTKSGWTYPSIFNFNPSQNAIKRIDYIVK